MTTFTLIILVLFAAVLAFQFMMAVERDCLFGVFVRKVSEQRKHRAFFSKD